MSRLVLLVLLLASCGPAPDTRERVLLVTTTTVEASGLLDALVDAYEGAQDRYALSVTAVGSGAALELGRRGDADLLVTHDPVGEARFIGEGHGLDHGPLMRNEFILAGPPEDPAGTRELPELAAALGRVSEAAAPFVSRGDESGTHRREHQLWAETGRAPWETRPDWYVESGSGMGETLRIADQREAYVLTDRATFLHLRDQLGLEALVRAEPPEINPYTWTVPARGHNPEGAADLLAWLRGPGQALIASYGVDDAGEPLFVATADSGSAPVDPGAPAPAASR